MGCIYMFTNQVTNEGYVGSCRVNVKRRYNAYIRGEGSQPLKEAIDEYGIVYPTVETQQNRIHHSVMPIYNTKAIYFAEKVSSLEPV